MSSCSATALPDERIGRAGAARAGLRATRLPLVATNEPFFAKREDYEAHDALICIAEGRLLAESDRRQLTPEHYFKTPRGDGGAVRRSAGGARRPRSRSRSAARTGRARASRSCRASPGEAERASTRRPSCGSRPKQGSSGASRSHGIGVRAAPRTTIASGSTSSSASSSG